MSGTQRTINQSFTDHNLTVLNKLERGDLIEFYRGSYSHWAVYVGNGKVVHMTGDENAGIGSSDGGSGTIFTVCGKEFNKAFAREDDFFDVALGCKAVINNTKDEVCIPLTAEEIIERAMSKIGRLRYNVLWNNCEHFATWCRYNVEWSEQANKFLTWISVASIIGSAVAILFGAYRQKRNQ